MKINQKQTNSFKTNQNNLMIKNNQINLSVKKKKLIDYNNNKNKSTKINKINYKKNSKTQKPNNKTNYNQNLNKPEKKKENNYIKIILKKEVNNLKIYNKKKILKFNKICFILTNKMKSQNNMLINFKKTMKIMKMSKDNNKLRIKNI